MKRILPVILVALIAFGCASKKKVYAPPFEEEEIETVVVTERTPKRNTQTQTQTPKQTQPEKPIRAQEEKVTMTHGSAMKRYNVIVGSFANETNAVNLRNKLNNEGYISIIMRNESGMSRVSIAGFDEEIPARNELMRIRSNYPDAWLLIAR